MTISSSRPDCSATALREALAVLPLLPRDEDGPIFAEPWQAQAFALVVELAERGALSWQEWSVRLGAELRAAEQAGDRETGLRYYDHWLRALEKLTVERGFAAWEDLAAEKDLIRRHDHHRREEQLHQHGQRAATTIDHQESEK